MIRIENVSIDLGEFRLRNTCLAIEKGEYLVLLGPTGAGKTVLVECILGIHRPRAGRIAIDGLDVSDLYPEERNIGYVPQDYMLFPNMTVDGNIAYGLQARKRPVADIKPRVENMLRMLGIEHLRFRMPLHLSGGERQRVALGRALITEPKILLLDEPLSALDENLRYELGAELRRLHDNIGGTFLHVCHHLDEAASVGDRWAIMHQGTVVQVGKADDVLARPVSEFVARFTRTRNIYRGHAEPDGSQAVVTLGGGLRLQAMQRKRGEVAVAIRPERIRVLSGHENPGPNVVSGRIVRRTSRATGQDLEVDVGILLAVSWDGARGDGAFNVGQEVKLHIPDSAVHLMPREG